ncbi:MAG: thioesterase [Stappia sp.]|uniref:PaaI family thioesterase n=1 Tax=Stappia sp. TaxID=1870903 RepID=UPI000C63A6D3|nr:PaaI family thioesterase [Stappia sp.]MAB00903.1 thioesterase [Stappia sp.]MBM22517.1 thioesterase [Stappia sp.]
MNVEELEVFLETEFPQIHVDGRIYRVETVSEGEAVLSVRALERHLRPGGTISGPTMMALVDLAAYAVILAHIGPVALAVTTNLNINFLRKPEPGDLLATCRLLKLGKRLAVTECTLTGRAGGDPVAHATATYSIPPR